ncbi:MULTISPECIES: hypothetical protein [Bacilli]|jgi:uncharacterized protein YybS (DUF2232 family)|nr:MULTISPECIES: hypothetical protein [Bacilli]MCM3032957.1 hypothetical protein [Niallia sp. MER 6]MDK8746835.1 hypothetical protein [Streptococcus agalactiae]
MEKFVAALLFIVLACFIFVNMFQGDMTDSIGGKTQQTTEVIDGTNVE